MGVIIDKDGNIEFDEEGKRNLLIRKPYGDKLVETQNDLKETNVRMKGFCRQIDRTLKKWTDDMWKGELSDVHIYINEINDYLEKSRDLIENCIKRQITIRENDGTISFLDEDGTLIRISDISVIEGEEKEL